MKLELVDIHKRFEGVEVLRGIDLVLEPGVHACLMGASGAGKTTLLRIVAGLERHDRGQVAIGGRRLDDLPPERRPTHTLFQTPALFPHLSVADNVAFVARLRREPALRSRPRVDELLEQVGLARDYGDRRPDQLSGGERQRVALARALFEPPPWLLLDEPLTGLDRPRRAELRRLIDRLRRSAREPFGILHVTHEPEDALALADELIVLAAGRVHARGKPLDLYQRPPDRATAGLLGELTALPIGEGVIRPEHLRVVAVGEGRVEAELVRQVCAGDHWELELRTREGRELVAFAEQPWQGARACALAWDDDHAVSP
ncbi:ABC transporter ATP-binding protein [Nannocystaceae bacterium ST9]